MNTEATRPAIQSTGEATGFIPAPGNLGKPITVIGTRAIRDAFDAKCIEQALNSRGSPGNRLLVSQILVAIQQFYGSNAARDYIENCNVSAKNLSAR